MLTNGGNTEGLFRAAFMQSGSPIPVGDITHGQRYYDAVVQEVGCSTASDTLACLRTVDYAALHRAMNNSPGVYYGGDADDLFRAVSMRSGSPIPVDGITYSQQYYDAVVQEVGCSTASDSLACLRTVDYANLHAAMDNSPGISSYQVYSSALHTSDKPDHGGPCFFPFSL